MYFSKSLKPLLCALCALLAITAVNATGFQQAPHVKIVNGIPYPDTNTTYSPVSNETNSSSVSPTVSSPGVQNGTSPAVYLQATGNDLGSGISNQSISNLTGPSSPNGTPGTPLVMTPGITVTRAEYAAAPTTTPAPSVEAGRQFLTNNTATPVPTPVAGESGNGSESSTHLPGVSVSVPVTTLSSDENHSRGEYETGGEPLASRFSNAFPATPDDLSGFARMKAFPPIELIERLIGAALSAGSPVNGSPDPQAPYDTGNSTGNETVSL